MLKKNIVYVGQEKAPYTGVVESYGDNGVLAGKLNLKMVKWMELQKYTIQMEN